MEPKYVTLCIVLPSAAAFWIQNRALRICCVAFQFSIAAMAMAGVFG
jgi:hypothetical protein